MQYRRLGKTGHESSMVILGTAALGNSNPTDANAAMDHALAAGINHFDVAPQYGKAQELVGPWLESRRDQVYISCKTLERERDTARADLENSLKLLRTGVLDVYQFHAVTTQEDLDRIFAPGGAAETFTQARDEGLVRALGITGHGMQAPALQLAALDRLDMATVMFPLNPRLMADTDYRRDAERLLDVAQQRDLGVMIIKAAARGPWGEKDKTYGPWYEPYIEADRIAAGVRFVLSQPGVTTVASAGDTRLVGPFVDAVNAFTPMPEAEQAALIAARANDELIFAGPHALSKG